MGKYDISITAKKAIVNTLIAMLAGGITYLASLPQDQQMGGAMLAMVIMKMLENYLKHRND